MPAPRYIHVGRPILAAAAFQTALLLITSACTANTPKIALPPPAPTPQPDPPALIFTQTVLDLPDPQPIPPEAIPKRQIATEPAPPETPPVRTPVRRMPTITKKEPEAAEPAVQPQPEPVKPSPRTPLVPSGENIPKSDIIQKRLDALKAMQPRLTSKTGSDAEMTRTRIQYFIDQAAKALGRKDLRQADALATRAEVLAQDLLGVR